MADSDITTTLPVVTRRRVLEGAAIAIVGSSRRAVARYDQETPQLTDPAVAVWRKWCAAHKQTERLCREQQRLERKLVEAVGFPSATIQPSEGKNVTLHSLQALRIVLDLAPEDVAMRAKAETDFAHHQERWDAVDSEIGYSATLRAEREAADRTEELLELLSETPAASLAGVVAKLDAVLMEGEPSEGSSEFPWPQIRSALDDLMTIGKIVAEQAFPEEQPSPLQEQTGGGSPDTHSANGSGVKSRPTPFR
ncbi:hypothetical protein RFM68_15295 [Mesorhizobium sp. MSK_1335]|uniref:Terminase small subunit n=1 Tax=Mesorhizobium montanum TaxID=3072323 RepID=A0ABU4ZLH1_9HYPH|nr:hypothetical protein [Mesorhizobium sp. MSK_1335]MDX8525877.1 hypothetical protein [Mesorhizobium sp. MSK_1335]